jgi:hypothetical protein
MYRHYDDQLIYVYCWTRLEWEKITDKGFENEIDAELFINEYQRKLEGKHLLREWEL